MEEGGLFSLKHIFLLMDLVRTRLIVREVKAASAPSMTHIHLSDLSCPSHLNIWSQHLHASLKRRTLNALKGEVHGIVMSHVASSVRWPRDADIHMCMMCMSLILLQPMQTWVDCPGHLLTSRCPAQKRTINHSLVLDVRFSEVRVQSDQCNLSVADLQSPRCLKPHYKGQQRNCVRHEGQPQGLTCRVINLTSKDFYSGSLRADQWGLIRFWPRVCVCVFFKSGWKLNRLHSLYLKRLSDLLFMQKTNVFLNTAHLKQHLYFKIKM